VPPADTVKGAWQHLAPRRRRCQAEAGHPSPLMGKIADSG